MSTHRVEVVRLDRIDPHPSADRLEIVTVWGYTVCVGKGQFQPGDLAVYIPPDYVVPPLPQWAFLGEHRHIKVKKLRGVVSQGLLVPAPAGAVVGQDLMDAWLIVRYEPPLPPGDEDLHEPGPLRPVYDVEAWERYPGLIADGEIVACTEKVHGESMRICHEDGRDWVGSRTRWKVDRADSGLWKAARHDPAVLAFCRAHPQYTLYGERHGWVQSLRYGATPGESWFSTFAILEGNRWLSFEECAALKLRHGLPWVPIVHVGPFERTFMQSLAEGPTLINGAGHVREGIVLTPLAERTCPEIGRVQLKLVGAGYYASEKGARRPQVEVLVP